MSMGINEYKAGQEMIDKYLNKGYNKWVAQFAPASLPSDEIQILFEKGILQHGINEIFNATIKNKYGSLSATNDIWGKRAKAAGVRFAIEGFGGVMLLFTVDFLVVTHFKQTHFSTDGKGSSEETYEQMKLEPLVIPYSEILNMIITNKNMKGGWGEKTVTKAGDPLIGAVVGAVIGGATGAVIGAAATGRSKTQVIQRAGVFDTETFYFNMKGPRISVHNKQVFTISNKTKTRDRGDTGFTWAMNAIITEQYSIYGSCDVKGIQEFYNETLREYINKINRFQIQGEMLKILSEQYECELSCQKYATQKEFYEAMCRESKLREIQSVSCCLDTIGEALNKKKVVQKELQEQLDRLRGEREKIKFWKLDEKRQKDTEIYNAEKALDDFNEGFYQETTLQFSELVKQESSKIKTVVSELSESQAAILELLRDGRPRTISEMQESSDKLTAVSNQRLADMLRKLTERGVLESSLYNEKKYFSIVDRYQDATFQISAAIEQEDIKTTDTKADASEFSEGELAIMELLQDGKKRTVMEMLKDGDKRLSTFASHQRVAALSKSLADRGVLERVQLDGKTYFSIADMYRQ